MTVINQSFILRNFVSKTIEVTDAHTDAHTADVIQSILEDYGRKDQQNAKDWAVTDSATNMKKPVAELGWPRIQCFAHALHSTLIKSSKDTPDVVDLTSKSRKTVKYFSASTKKSFKLTDVQSKLHLSHVKLKRDVITRWNPCFDMLQRLLSNKTAIINVALTDEEVEKLILITSEWYQLTTIRDFLVLFRDITDALCTAAIPSISISDASTKPFFTA